MPCFFKLSTAAGVIVKLSFILSPTKKVLGVGPVIPTAEHSIAYTGGVKIQKGNINKLLEINKMKTLENILDIFFSLPQLV